MTTQTRAAVVEVIRAQRVIAIIRAGSASAAVTSARALLDGGLRAIEISMSTPRALDAVAQLRAEHDGALIGVGTVLDIPTAMEALAAGAQFLVSPVLPQGLIGTAHSRGAPVVPGVMTPSEALAAHAQGADLIKLFPASQWSPSSLRDLLQALPQLPLVPTGGIPLDDAAEWIRAGAVTVGMGGSLTRGDAAQTSARAARLLSDLREAVP
jgi:2-dehydro-3-deoxyphosphogluconate aldolase/(4S)-4-hydroxy-2-oxoglutarate aldolase